MAASPDLRRVASWHSKLARLSVYASVPLSLSLPVCVSATLHHALTALASLPRTECFLVEHLRNIGGG